MAEEDIIFGKHRHLFGGVEPSNMRNFYVEWNGSNVNINAELPEDTVVDGQTLCTVAGAVIRRKTNGYPKDEFDGDLVKTIYESGSFVDTAANDSETIYYYAAFPFSTQDVYNRSEENYAIVNSVELYDGASSMIFSKNGKYGVIKSMLHPTSKMLMVNIYLYTVSTMIDHDGWCLCKRDDRFPLNESDGEVVSEKASYAMLCEVEDYNVVEGTTYYYSLFFRRKKSDGSVIYDYNITHRFTVTARPCSYLFGFDLDVNDPNPNTRVTYPDDVDNSAFRPAKMDYTGGSFDYGDWPNNSIYGFIPSPVMLTSAGTVGQVLNPNDYTYISNSTSASNVANTSYDGNAMMQWPKIYTYREYNTGTGIYKFRCSDYQHDSNWKCWCNYDKDGNEIDYFYTAIYPGSTDSSSKLRSLSGQTVKTAISPSQAIDYVDNNGTAWHIDTLADRLLIQDLLVLMAKTTDCQKAYGKGICGGSTADTTTGDMDTYGLFWGSQDPTKGVKVFGMENWWGNHERYLAGAISISGSLYVKITRSTKDGSTATDYNLTGSGYVNKGTAMKIAGNIKEMNCYNFGRLPKSSGGSSTTYECDTARIDTSGTYYAMAGGNSKLSEHEVGPFQLRFMYSPTGTTTSTERVAALSYKG